MKSFRLFIALILTSLMIASCATTGDVFVPSEDFDLFDMYNSYCGSVFMGISGRYTSDEEGTKVALMNCARNIALSEDLTVRADVDIMDITKIDYEQFKVNAKSLYDESRIMSILSDIEIADIGRGDLETGMYVLAYYDGSEEKHFNYNVSFDSSGRPSWVDDPPKINGYVTAVGSAKEYYYLQDSIEAAAFEGAVSLVFVHADTLVVSNEILKMEDSAYSNDMKRDLYQINYNILQDFTVLAYWYDKNERTYHALVAAKEA